MIEITPITMDKARKKKCCSMEKKCEPEECMSWLSYSEIKTSGSTLKYFINDGSTLDKGFCGLVIK